MSARVDCSLKELTLAGPPDAPADDASVEFMRLGVGDSFGEMSLITVRGLTLKDGEVLVQALI